MIRIDIKPLSVNEAWQGKRFKTPKYKAYEKHTLLLLPSKIQLPTPPYRIDFEFGLSSSLSDWDNPIKPTQDIICKKYGINDKLISEGNVKKIKVKKGEEYFRFKIDSA